MVSSMGWDVCSIPGIMCASEWMTAAGVPAANSHDAHNSSRLKDAAIHLALETADVTVDIGQ